jgi:hypothetical protein
MPRGDKSSYTNKQKRRAEHIEDSYEDRGISHKEAERRAWAPDQSASDSVARELFTRRDTSHVCKQWPCSHAACLTRVSISLRSSKKSMGLVKSASAPPSNALRLVSASP